jgi:beta-glucanase (GH16 family)
MRQFGLRHVALLLIGLLLIVGAGYGVVSTLAESAAKSTRPRAVEPGWQLRFSDEFDASEIESSKWSTCFHFGVVEEGALRCILGEKPFGVHEPDNVSVAGGNALLQLNREKRAVFGKSFDYTFGMLSSHEAYSFTFGYAEISAKVPKGMGVWPAFWLLPADKSWPPEIDVIEYLGRDPETIHGTLHYADFKNAHQSIGGTFRATGLADGFHTYAVKWSAQELIWYVDGVEYFRMNEHVPAQPMYIVVSHGAGTPDSWGGPLGNDVVYPNVFEVDYVRVYAP